MLGVGAGGCDVGTVRYAYAQKPTAVQKAREYRTDMMGLLARRCVCAIIPECPGLVDALIY